MAWYWIVLLILLYILIGGIVAGLAKKYFNDSFDFDDEENLILIGVFWPFVIIFGIPAIVAYIGYCLIVKEDGSNNR